MKRSTAARAGKACLAMALAMALALTFSTTAHPAAALAATAEGPSLSLNPGEGTVGTPATVTGRGFPAGADIELVWETWDAAVTAEGNMYAGWQKSPRVDVLASVRAGQDGSFSYAFAVPEDYGGMHTITARSGGAALAQSGFRLWPRLTLLTQEGPAGTPIRLQGDGFGLGLTDSQFHVRYNNRYMGLFSAAASRGKVDLVIPAVGGVGPQRIDISANYYGPAYLNLQDGFPEYRDVPRWSWDFNITPGAAEPHPAAATGRYVSTVVAGKVPELPEGPPLTATPAQGPVGEVVTFTASGFRPGEPVELVWRSIVGAYIVAGGFRYEDEVLATASAGADGSVRFDIEVPPRAGAWHPVLARAASQTAVGTFGVVRAITVTPLSGPVGTPIHIRITGAGWRSWENNTSITWDNGYTGYACALNDERGTINVYLTAVGEPGRHVIGLWPAIFRGPATVNYGGTQPDNQRLPVLTPTDLPEYVEPVFFSFDVTAPEGTAAGGSPGTAVAGGGTGLARLTVAPWNVLLAGLIGLAAGGVLTSGRRRNLWRRG